MKLTIYQLYLQKLGILHLIDKKIRFNQSNNLKTTLY